MRYCTFQLGREPAPQKGVRGAKPPGHTQKSSPHKKLEHSQRGSVVPRAEPFNQLRTYFHTISVSNNWVVFSALRILSTEIARKFWRIERTIRTCFCIQFIWRIFCDPLYLQLFRCWIPFGSHLVHILDKLINVLVCVIRAKHRIWSLKKFAHSSGWS